MIKRYDVYETAEFGTMREYCETGCHVDADDAVALAESHARLLEALTAAVQSGMVPSSSALAGGACRYSLQVQVADQIREAIAAAQPFAEK